MRLLAGLRAPAFARPGFCLLDLAVDGAHDGKALLHRQLRLDSGWTALQMWFCCLVWCAWMWRAGLYVLALIILACTPSKTFTSVFGGHRSRSALDRSSNTCFHKNLRRNIHV